jgi:response regulator of citrate/malate metabolism
MKRASRIHFIPHVKSIPPSIQRVLNLIEKEPLTVKEMADRLNLTQKTVRSYLSKVAELHKVHAQGPYGARRYWVDSNNTI